MGRLQQRAIGGGVGLTFAADAKFRNEFPIELAGAVFEQFLKGGADGGFVLDAELGKFGEAGVISGNLFMGGLEIQARHRGRLEKRRAAVNSPPPAKPALVLSGGFGKLGDAVDRRNVSARTSGRGIL